MKKIILFITILLILTGCQTEKHSNTQTSNNEIPNNQQEEQISEEKKYIDNNPIKVALYENNSIVKSYTTTLSNFKDIAVFDIFFTNEEHVNGKTTKENYLEYYNKYDNINNYKTGFHFSFEADSKQIEHTVLDPSSKHAMTPYLYIYLYDDINQKPNAYYSHLEPEDMKENTIFSSIKLFLAQEGIKITSPITMTVFTYDSEDDFTEDNHYRGQSSYTIKIETN